MEIQAAERQIFWNISHPVNQVLLYVFFALSVLICGYGLLARFKLWTEGLPDSSRFGSWVVRLRIFVEETLFQRKVSRDQQVRIFHSFIFVGFLILLFTTTMVFIDHDLGIEIYRGRFYLILTFLSDLFGILFLFGIFLAFYRRYIAKPDFLHNTPADFFMLFLLLLLIVQGFLLEAIRIRVTADPWAAYSPVGSAFALLFSGLSPRALAEVHFVTWWFHTLSVFIFIALIPYSKFFHILTGGLNMFFTELTRPKGALTFPGNIEALIEASAEERAPEFRIGIKTITDLTWKQRLDLDSCTSCGRCQAVCPAYASGKPLSPKWLILDSRNHLLSLHAAGIPTANNTPSKKASLWHRVHQTLLKSMLLTNQDGTVLNEADRGKNKLVQQALKSQGQAASDSLSGMVMDEDVFWACTTCRACIEVCPVGIEHVDYILDVRRSMALIDGNLPQETQASLRAIETRGNPFGDPKIRAAWAEGLAVPVLTAGDAVEVLYWVGCVSSYDKRKQKIARAMVNILNQSGIRWGILGSAENCTGDPARRLGEENLFQSMAKKNIELLGQVTFTTLVANCPHCFNTFKNEYPQLGKIAEGKNIRIIHHSQFLIELLQTKRLTLTKPLDKSVTFHDPCYLGRYNDTYNEPREVLVQLGKQPIREMENSREKAMCCGAGGGHYWFDMKSNDRVNVLRINQVAETGAEVVATACPFCMQMLEDGAKLTERENVLAVRDIAELVSEAL